MTTSGVDLSLFLNPKQIAIWQIFSTFLMMDGGFSEWLRRVRAGDDL